MFYYTGQRSGQFDPNIYSTASSKHPLITQVSNICTQVGQKIWYLYASPTIQLIHMSPEKYFLLCSPLRHTLEPADVYTSVNWVNIGSSNDLAPDRCQAITWINDDLLSTGSLGTNFSAKFELKHKTFLSRKGIVVCQMSAILFRPPCVYVLHLVVCRHPPRQPPDMPSYALIGLQDNGDLSQGHPSRFCDLIAGKHHSWLPWASRGHVTFSLYYTVNTGTSY